MRIEYISGDREYSFPALRCHGCWRLYHLPHGVRRDELVRLSCQAEAKTRGWTVPDEGPVYCPDCKPHQPEDSPK